MNIDFEAALRYIDLGSYDKAIAMLKSAIDKETEKNDLEHATQYRCVLGELYANLGQSAESREEFQQVVDYCDETHTLQKQYAIAKSYIDAMDKGQTLPERPKRPGDAPLVPKPRQDKLFIAKQSRKNHK